MIEKRLLKSIATASFKGHQTVIRQHSDISRQRRAATAGEIQGEIAITSVAG
jgi:hypothetical protein